MKWSDSLMDSVEMKLRKTSEIVKDRGAWHATSLGVEKS